MTTRVSPNATNQFAVDMFWNALVHQLADKEIKAEDIDMATQRVLRSVLLVSWPAGNA